MLILINNTKHALGMKYYTVGHSHQFESHCCCFNILASYGDIASLHSACKHACITSYTTLSFLVPNVELLSDRKIGKIG